MKAKQNDASQQRGKKLHLIEFKVGNELYAVGIEQVKEVVLTPPITPLPMTPYYILGIANVRGDVLTMVDIKARIVAKENLSRPQSTFTLVLENSLQRIGVVVEDMPSSTIVFEDELEEPPHFSEEKGNQKWILNIIKSEGKLILLIDLNQLTSSKELEEAYSTLPIID